MLDGYNSCGSKLVARLVHSILHVLHVPATVSDHAVYQVVGQGIVLV